MILNNVLLAVALVTVLLGTLYPMFLDAMGLGTVTVGSPYYKATFVPLLVPLVLVMAAGPLIPWKRADALAILLRLKVAGLLARSARASPMPGRAAGRCWRLSASFAGAG